MSEVSTQRPVGIAPAPVRMAPASNGDVTPAPVTPQISIPDGAAMLQALKSGETFQATMKDGVFQASKAGGENAFDKAVNWVKGVAWGVGSTLAGTVDGALGISPGMTVLQVVQSAHSLMSSNSLIPGSVSGFVTASFYPWFRLIMPGLDALQLANTIKVAKAQKKLDDMQQKQPDGPPPQKSWWQKLVSVVKNPGNLSIAVDALHLGLDVGLGAVIGGYLLQGFTAAVIMPAFLPAWLTLGAALSIAYAGDLAAGIWHGLGATANLADASEGAGPGERSRKFAFHYQLQRVFGGKEPLLHPSDPPVNPPAGPDNGPPSVPPVIPPIAKINAQPIEA